MGLYDHHKSEKYNKTFCESGTIFGKHLIVLARTSSCTSKNRISLRGYSGYPRDPESLFLLILSSITLKLIN